MDYKHGRIEQDSNGTFVASHWVANRNGSKTLALAGQGYGFATIELAQAAIDATDPNEAIRPSTPAESDKWFAIHGVPSAKSLKNLDAKLAAIKRAEEIENGDETL